MTIKFPFIRVRGGWKIQIQPLLAFKRWAFSRCCRCHKGFKWGESPVSHSWNGTGPLWFRSEQHIYHDACSAAVVQERDKAHEPAQN